MTVTVSEVRAIYNNAAPLQDIQIQAVIGFVDTLSAEWFTGIDYSATMLNAIQRFMVAHFLSVGFENGGVILKKTGQSEEQYNPLTRDAAGLGASIYGQQAMALDVKGILSAMAAKTSAKANFRVI